VINGEKSEKVNYRESPGKEAAGKDQDLPGTPFKETWNAWRVMAERSHRERGERSPWTRDRGETEGGNQKKHEATSAKEKMVRINKRGQQSNHKKHAGQKKG